MKSKAGLQYCELCGAPIFGRKYVVEIEGAELTVCPSCYLKLVRSGKIKIPRKTKKAEPVIRKTTPTKPGSQSHGSSSKPTGKPQYRSSKIPLDRYEVVEDYAERIRRAREKLGLSRAELARKVQEREVTLGKIETGRLRPTLELARRLERVLKVKLLEPIVDSDLELEELEEDRSRGKTTLTLGDVAVLRKRD
ncbi:MAG: multiprotein bridging factor aMBF1 [Desulfurococcales archaeon]|nr:multiprotein bridging factor aMBF1 [Desulfurococcales archaeon]